MELKDLEKLMKVFEESDSREFKLDDGDFHLYLSKNKHHAPVEAPVQAAGPSCGAGGTTSPSSRRKGGTGG
ncbi:MAG: hypothetical protein ACFWUH_04675 [Limosilactobacillus fermentum]|jgi:acetyl-CoA carboxylase biotin carboxyl carrier protein